MHPHRRGVTALLVTCLMFTGAQAATPSVSAPGAATRLQALEDREAIRLVLRDYGRLLDERRFEEFGQLFAADAEYVSAGTTTRGPAAIADSLRRAMAGNALSVKDPNFHVLFNERITLQGDRAEASSQSFFVAPGADGSPQLLMMATYEDRLVRTAAGWRFEKRVVRGNLMQRPVRAP